MGRSVFSRNLHAGMSEGEGEGGSDGGGAEGVDEPNAPPPGLSKTGHAMVTQMTERARVCALSLHS
jgi:hypothetical protein